jgi:hypothetical protein
MQVHEHKDHRSIVSWRVIPRRKKRRIPVGWMEIGGHASKMVQTLASALSGDALVTVDHLGGPWEAVTADRASARFQAAMGAGR